MLARGSSPSLLGQHLFQRSTCLAGRGPSWALPRFKLGYARLSSWSFEILRLLKFFCRKHYCIVDFQRRFIPPCPIL
jgi:hypothetical protein